MTDSALISQHKKKSGNPNWYKGMPASNPGGLTSRSKGLEDPGPRMKFLAQQHGIEAILKAMENRKYLADNFSTYDGMLIMGLANSLKGNGEERERMLNRMFGKVPERNLNLTVNVDVAPDQLSDRAASLLARIATFEDELIED